MRFCWMFSAGVGVAVAVARCFCCSFSSVASVSRVIVTSWELTFQIYEVIAQVLLPSILSLESLVSQPGLTWPTRVFLERGRAEKYSFCGMVTWS